MKGKGDDAPDGGGSGEKKKSALDKLKEAKSNPSDIPATPASFAAQQAETRNQTKANLSKHSDTGLQFLNGVRGAKSAPAPEDSKGSEVDLGHVAEDISKNSGLYSSMPEAAKAAEEEEEHKDEALQSDVVEGDIETAKEEEQIAKNALEEQKKLAEEIERDEAFDEELEKFEAGQKEFEDLSVKASAAAWGKAQEQGSAKGPMGLREARAKNDQIKNDEAIAQAMHADELAAAGPAATPQPTTASVGTQTGFPAANPGVGPGMASNVPPGGGQVAAHGQSGGRRAVDLFGGPGFSSHPAQGAGEGQYVGGYQGSEFDAITNAIQNQVLIPQQLALYSEYYKNQPELLHANKLVDLQKFRKEVLSTKAGRDFVAKAMQDKAFQAKMHGIESSGYSRVHQDFAKQLRDIEWSKGNKENQSVIKNKKGEEVCTLKESTISKSSKFTLTGGKSISVKGYRKIDFPAQLDQPNGPMHLSMALRDETGENMSEDGAIYFTAHYNKQGQLTEVSSPVPIKFMGKESDKDAIGYIERDGHIYTLPVTRGNYESMMMAVQKHQGLGVNMSQGMSQARDLALTDELHHEQYQQQTMSQHLSNSVGQRVTSSALQMQPQVQNPRSPQTPDALLRQADQYIFSAEQQLQVMQQQERQRPAPAPNVDAAIASWQADTQAQQERLETAVTLQDRLQQKIQSSKRKKLSQKEQKQLAAAEGEAEEALAAIDANRIKEAYLRDTLESARQVPGQEGVDISQDRIAKMKLHYTPGSSNLKTAELLVKGRAAEREAEQVKAAIAAVAQAEIQDLKFQGLSDAQIELYQKEVEILDAREAAHQARNQTSGQNILMNPVNSPKAKEDLVDKVQRLGKDEVEARLQALNESAAMAATSGRAGPPNPGDLNVPPPIPPKPYKKMAIEQTIKALQAKGASPEDKRLYESFAKLMPKLDQRAIDHLFTKINKKDIPFKKFLRWTVEMKADKSLLPEDRKTFHDQKLEFLQQAKSEGRGYNGQANAQSLDQEIKELPGKILLMSDKQLEAQKADLQAQIDASRAAAPSGPSLMDGFNEFHGGRPMPDPKGANAAAAAEEPDSHTPASANTATSKSPSPSDAPPPPPPVPPKPVAQKTGAELGLTGNKATLYDKEVEFLTKNQELQKAKLEAGDAYAGAAVLSDQELQKKMTALLALVQKGDESYVATRLEQVQKDINTLDSDVEPPTSPPLPLGDTPTTPGGGHSSDLLSQIQAGKALRKTPTPTPAPADPNKKPTILDQIKDGVALKHVDQKELAQKKDEREAAASPGGITSEMVAKMQDIRKATASEDTESDVSGDEDDWLDRESEKVGSAAVGTPPPASEEPSHPPLTEENLAVYNAALESKGPGVDTTKPPVSPPDAPKSAVADEPPVPPASPEQPVDKSQGVKIPLSVKGHPQPIAGKLPDVPPPPPRLNAGSEPMTPPEANSPGGAVENKSADFKQQLESALREGPDSPPKPETKLTLAQEELKTLYEQFHDKRIQDARSSFGEGSSQEQNAQKEKQNAINSIAGLGDEAVKDHIQALQETRKDWHDKAVKTQKGLGVAGVQAEFKKAVEAKGAAEPSVAAQGAAKSSPAPKKSPLPPPPAIGTPSNQVLEAYGGTANTKFSPPSAPPPPPPLGADATLDEKRQVLKDYVSKFEGLGGADESLYQNANKGLDVIDMKKADELLGKTANSGEFKKSLQEIVPPPAKGQGAAQQTQPPKTSAPPPPPPPALPEKFKGQGAAAGLEGDKAELYEKRLYAMNLYNEHKKLSPSQIEDSQEEINKYAASFKEMIPKMKEADVKKDLRSIDKQISFWSDGIKELKKELSQETQSESVTKQTPTPAQAKGDAAEGAKAEKRRSSSPSPSGVTKGKGKGGVDSAMADIKSALDSSKGKSGAQNINGDSPPVGSPRPTPSVKGVNDGKGKGGGGRT